MKRKFLTIAVSSLAAFACAGALAACGDGGNGNIGGVILPRDILQKKFLFSHTQFV